MRQSLLSGNGTIRGARCEKAGELASKTNSPRTPSNESYFFTCSPSHTNPKHQFPIRIQGHLQSISEQRRSLSPVLHWHFPVPLSDISSAHGAVGDRPRGGGRAPMGRWAIAHGPMGADFLGQRNGSTGFVLMNYI